MIESDSEFSLKRRLGQKYKYLATLWSKKALSFSFLLSIRSIWKQKFLQLKFRKWIFETNRSSDVWFRETTRYRLRPSRSRRCRLQTRWGPCSTSWWEPREMVSWQLKYDLHANDWKILLNKVDFQIWTKHPMKLLFVLHEGVVVKGQKASLIIEMFLKLKIINWITFFALKRAVA